jgi:hypothetical protein
MLLQASAASDVILCMFSIDVRWITCYNYTARSQDAGVSDGLQKGAV